MAQKMSSYLRARVREIDRASFFVGSRRYDDLTAHEIIAHDLRHLVKATSKVAAYCDAHDHNADVGGGVLEREVIPDLIVYAVHLANALDVDIDDVLEQRLKYILTKYPAIEPISASQA
jgi:hypothetical protein